jgi:hypothetical protein
MKNQWAKELPISIMLCDNEGTVTEMNEKASTTFADEGGYGLIGQNLFGCHSVSSNEKIREIMREKKPNIYTIEKNGKKKLIYQAPWYENGEAKGLIELSIELPTDMPHFVR